MFHELNMNWIERKGLITKALCMEQIAWIAAKQSQLACVSGSLGFSASALNNDDSAVSSLPAHN